MMHPPGPVRSLDCEMASSNFPIRNHLVDVAIVAAAILTAVAFWTRNFIAIALLIPTGIILVRNKAVTKEERERRETLATRSLAVSLILPISLIMCLVIYFFIIMVPRIIYHWQF